MSFLLGLLAGWALAGQADAETLYARDFQGEFAPRGACVKTTERWVFTARDVTQGQIACQVTKVELQSGHMVVTARNCTKAGKAIQDRDYVLDLMSEDVIKAQVAETSALLQRCPSR